MKVVLLQEVKGVGKADEIKEVSEGYARNFLFPRHWAVIAKDKALKELSDKKIKQSKDAEADLKMQQDLAAKLDGVEITIKEKASEAGVLYAAVGQAKIMQELGRRGIKLERNQLSNTTIKKAGEYPIKVKLRHGLEAEITVRVETL
ncbi:MAG: 50S ribosomal protein L9 [Candidatus Magasanikbacteria bacterium]|nr:50S ribosomal protein L9 [Candidatus Magasanikbacteria bacterium]